MEKCTPTRQVVLLLLVHEWSFPVCRYTATHLFTKVKSSIAAFRPHRTRRSVTAKQRGKKQGINITGSFILNWSRNLGAFTSPFLNGIFNSCKYICFNFLCSCNNFSWTIFHCRLEVVIQNQVIIKSIILLPRTVSHLIDCFNKPEKGLSTDVILRLWSWKWEHTSFWFPNTHSQSLSHWEHIYIHTAPVCILKRNQSLFITFMIHLNGKKTELVSTWLK